MKWISFVELENFKIHRYKKVEFDRHMNIITGESDLGKSTILKGIIKCVYNKPEKKGESFLSWGAERGAKVKIRVGIKDDNKGELSVASATETIIERVLGKSGVNEYNIYYPNGEVSNYSNFGRNVPPEVISVHGMREVDMGYGKEQLNYMGQFEGFFLIGKRPEEVATAIGRLAQTEVIDKVKEGLRSDITVNSRKIGSNNKDIESVEVVIDSYQYLKDYEQAIPEIEALLSDAKEKYNHIDKATLLSRKIKTAAIKTEDLQEMLDERIDFETVYQSISESTSSVKMSEAVTSRILNKVTSSEKYLEKVNLFIDTFPNLDDIKLDLACIGTDLPIIARSSQWDRLLKGHSERLATVSEKTEKEFDFDNFRETIDIAIKKLREVEQLTTMARKIKTYAERISDKYDMAIEYSEDLVKTREDLKAAMGDNCPLCGTDIKNRSIDELSVHLTEL